MAASRWPSADQPRNEDDEDGGGEDLSRGYGYAPGNEDDAEPNFDDEPSDNAPVSGVFLALDVTGEAVP